MSKLGKRLIKAAKQGVAIARGERYTQIVAWRVKDFADGWILYSDEQAARREAEATGAKIEPLYRLINHSELSYTRR